MALPKLNARKVSEMRRLYSDPDSALTYADLAAMYDVSEAVVRYHLYDLAKKRFPQYGKPKICFVRLEEMLNAGASLPVIAQEMNVVVDSVRRAKRRMGLRAAA